MRPRPLQFLLVLFALSGPSAVAAQDFHISIGPAQRGAAGEIAYYGGTPAWDARAIEASWALRLSPRLRLLLGGGFLTAPSITAYYPSPLVDADPFAPCLPDTICAPPVAETLVSGDLAHLRTGIAFEEGWFLVAAGVVAAQSSAGNVRRGSGRFVELRLRPIARVRRLSVGVLAIEMSRAPGGQKSVLMPSLGLRF